VLSQLECRLGSRAIVSVNTSDRDTKGTRGTKASIGHEAIVGDGAGDPFETSNGTVFRCVVHIQVHASTCDRGKNRLTTMSI